MIHSGQAKAGDLVLVHGASGAVGLAAVQLAANNGMIVVGTAGTEEGMRLIKENGAKFAFNHRDSSYLEDIQRSVGGRIQQTCTAVRREKLNHHALFT